MINQQIATALNVNADQIKSVTEMAWVYCVVVFGRRATFVSKKAVVAKPVITKLDIANQIALAWEREGFRGAKVWQGGDVVRVYLEKGFVQVGRYGLDCRKLNHYSAYQVIRGIEYSELAAAPAMPEWQRKGYMSQLDFDMEDPNGMYFG